MSEVEPFLLEVKDLACAYGTVKVLDGVSFTVKPGEILGIIGENGAGKSTLVKAILGLLKPSSGAIRLNGRAAAIHQEFNLVRDLTAAENIFLGREKKNALGFLDKKQMSALAAGEFAKMNASVDPDTPVSELSISDRQMVEIAKATAAGARLLIMDEPSTLLNERETENLFRIMRDCKAHGNSVIYISHKLEEVREICDKIAVLRDGTLIDVVRAADTSPAEMAEKMVGRELTRLFPKKSVGKMEEPPVLKAEHLVSGDKVRDVSFELHRGEILGVAGLAGAGRSELAETIFGLRKIDGGKLLLDGREVHFASPAAAIRNGIGFLTEDRQESGLLTDFDLCENVTLASLENYVSHVFVNDRRIRKTAQEYIARFRIRCSGADALLKNLSGGNQQKTAIAKVLDTHPKIFIFDEPTRGVDVGARRDIYDFIHALAESGMACLMICSDLEELLGMCRKVMVMHSGVTAGFVEGESLNEKSIIYLAAGVEREKVS